MATLDKYLKPADKVIRELAEMQLLASRVDQQRKSLIALDERRQKLREAEGTLRKSKTQGQNTFVCLGPTTFISFPTTTAADFLNEDRKIVEDAITETDKDLREKMSELLKKEGNKDLIERGFGLKAANK